MTASIVVSHTHTDTHTHTRARAHTPQAMTNLTRLFGLLVPSLLLVFDAPARSQQSVLPLHHHVRRRLNNTAREDTEEEATTNSTHKPNKASTAPPTASPTLVRQGEKPVVVDLDLYTGLAPTPQPTKKPKTNWVSPSTPNPTVARLGGGSLDVAEEEQPERVSTTNITSNSTVVFNTTNSTDAANTTHIIMNTTTSINETDIDSTWPPEFETDVIVEKQNGGRL